MVTCLCGWMLKPMGPVQVTRSSMNVFSWQSIAHDQADQPLQSNRDIYFPIGDLHLPYKPKCWKTLQNTFWQCLRRSLITGYVELEEQNIDQVEFSLSSHQTIDMSYKIFHLSANAWLDQETTESGNDELDFALSSIASCACVIGR